MPGERKHRGITFNPAGRIVDPPAARRSHWCYRNNIVGFYWGGWALGSTADKMAKERSDQAVVAALGTRLRRQVSRIA
jgi:hypothetical protein